MKKKYWEYKKEETKKCWHDLVNWWHEWGIFFGLFGWLIPIFIGSFVAIIFNNVIGVAIILSAVWGWIPIFCGWLIIVSEIDAFRAWKKKRNSIVQEKTEVKSQ